MKEVELGVEASVPDVQPPQCKVGQESVTNYHDDQRHCIYAGTTELHAIEGWSSGYGLASSRGAAVINLHA